MIIAIDFDGTIVENNFPHIGQLMPGAKETIQKLFDEGHYIIIWTSRGNEQLRDAVNFLLHNQIPFHCINDNNPDNTAKYSSNSRKVYAHCYIDDRNLGGFPGWDTAYRLITEAENEYKAKQNNLIEIEHNVESDDKRGIQWHCTSSGFQEISNISIYFYGLGSIP